MLVGFFSYPDLSFLGETFLDCRGGNHNLASCNGKQKQTPQNISDEWPVWVENNIIIIIIERFIIKLAFYYTSIPLILVH